MKNELTPEYGISAMRSTAAAEWSTGMDDLRITDVMITASLSVQSPAEHSGSKIPL